MNVKIENGAVKIPEELMRTLQFEDGQVLELSDRNGCLLAAPSSGETVPQRPYTPDQELALYIVEAFPNLEEMVAMMAAVVDLKSRIPAGDEKLVQEIGGRLEEIIVRARLETEGEDRDETC